jgi:hypothetical protein
MGISIIISHEKGHVLEAGYFVKELREKWPEAKIHFITDPSAHSLLQFKLPDDLGILGDFSGSGISYKGSGRSADVQFALWYRSVVPIDWGLRIYDSAMTFDLIVLTAETTEEQIIAGFDVPFDVSKYK